MGTLWRDLRYGFRMLARNKGFTSVAILALALGIGPNVAIFSIVYATLLAPLPYPQGDQLVVVWNKFKGERIPTYADDYLRYRSGSKSFSPWISLPGRNFTLPATASRMGTFREERQRLTSTRSSWRSGWPWGVAFCLRRACKILGRQVEIEGLFRKYVWAS